MQTKEELELNAKIKANEFLCKLKELMEKYDVTISYKVNELGIGRRSSMVEFDSCSAMNIYVGKFHAMEGKTFHPYIKADDIETIGINAY